MNQREIDRSIESLTKYGYKYTIDNGIVRWDSNNNVPPADMVAAMVSIGEDIDVAACDAAREEDTARVIEQYIKGQASRTEEQIAEQRYEARAAHGPGVKLTNIITGETYIT